MDEARLRALLTQLAAGETSPEAVLTQLKGFPMEDLGRIQLDHHRELRRGFPEVIYAPGKSNADLQQIAASILEKQTPLIVSRVSPGQATALIAAHPELQHDSDSALLWSLAAQQESLPVIVCVIAAGTSDIPVAAEAAGVARLAGCTVDTLYDCGVAGIHRLTAKSEVLQRADLLIVVAGMEGALPSVVGGLTSAPLIAVPTSVGYGTGLGGYAALLTMLNSCAAGSVVVNIDNGFGAGFFAGMLGRQIARRLRQEGSDAAS